MVDIYKGILNKIVSKAKKGNKRIVLPESDDKRILKAANIAARENIASIILIGKEDVIHNDCIKYGIRLDKNVRIIDPEKYDKTDEYANKLYELRKHKNMTEDEANLLMQNYIYFATMMVYTGDADGMVSGAIHSTSDTLRPALQIIKQKDNLNCVSSFFLMESNDKKIGENGVFLFADCGLIEEPTIGELSDIAISTVNSFKMLVEKEPKVAFLSYSTLGSAKGQRIDRIKEAIKILDENNVDFLYDGELQFDAATIKEVAKIKAPESKVAGDANVLIFPNLEAGNIGYKMAQRLGNMLALGPITQGMKKPVNDLSRGCSAEDIVGVIAITCVQAMDNI